MTTAILSAPGAADTTSASALAVDVHGLTKHYGRRAVVDQLDLTVPAGSVTGLIGPNGAGKTTVMAMLLGLVRPSAGRGSVLGLPLGHPMAYLPRVGALIETPAAFRGLTGRDNLRHLARLGGHDVARVDPLLERVGLGGRGADPVGTYSLGMKQRLGIAAALLPDPELVILDEPANGLDPVGMRDLRMLIDEMADEGRTVLVSSHLLAELEQVCDHLIVLDSGAVVHDGPTEALPRSHREALRMRTARESDLPRLVEVLAAAGMSDVRPLGDSSARLLVPTHGGDVLRLAARANEAAFGAGITLTEISPLHADLESRYLELVAADTATDPTTDIDHSTDIDPTAGGIR